ncbi:hypothetical protein PLEOSDRAFT_166634 [Pleurotus ostreatus PC15]|uniref:Uncharacterized protein n=1 Tax=Pleurotus ostreatus (strain PC15) TaxID=1137138 RepID=A0A067NU59_PLEO1|nr:hypothetical protein PLEOSDRAFT_166634 [Pleurotus ostreatus PC15]
MVIPNDTRFPFDKSTFYEIYGFKVEGRGQILHGEAVIEYCARLSPSQTNTEEPRYQATQGMSINLNSGNQLASTGGQGSYQEGGRPLARIKTKFLAMITCICGKDVINGDELPRATPVEGDPNISDPWNYQHNVHLDPTDYGISLNWANHIDIQSYLSEAQLDYTETTISDYMLFKQEPPIVALKRLRSWGIRPHLDETHLRHLEQVMQAGTTAHRRRLEPSSTTATAPSPQSLVHSQLEEEVSEEEPPAYSC